MTKTMIQRRIRSGSSAIAASLAVGVSLALAIGGASPSAARTTAVNDDEPRAALERKVIDLGGFGNNSYAVAINNSGQILGVHGERVHGPDRWVIWHDGEMTPLAGLPNSPTATAHDIDDQGRVTGTIRTDDGFRAFSWADGRLTDLGPLGGEHSFGLAIANGTVVGETWVGADRYRDSRGYLWRGGERVDIDLTAGVRVADVNASGQVAGSDGWGGGIGGGSSYHAFRWHPDSGGIDLGTLGGTWSEASAINDAGDVVGASGRSAAPYGAFFSDGQSMSVLSAPDFSAADALNADRSIVGHYREDGMIPHALEWTSPSAAGVRLPEPTGTYSSFAVDINDSGDIIGSIHIRNAQGIFERHAVVWPAVPPT